jgi:hypothetical protein
MMSLEKQIQKLEQQFEQKRTKNVRFQENPLDFFEQVLGFKPTDYQKQLTGYFMERQFVAARWCRQSGKSHIVSALGSEGSKDGYLLR